MQLRLTCCEPEQIFMGENQLGVALGLMLMIGMAAGAESPPALSPELFGLEEEPRWVDADHLPIEYPIDTPEGVMQRARAAQYWNDSGGPIPYFKLASRGGCRVTPEEIDRSLAIHDARVPTDEVPEHVVMPLPDDLGGELSIDWWREWIAFLRRAKDGGGFTIG